MSLFKDKEPEVEDLQKYISMIENSDFSQEKKDELIKFVTEAIKRDVPDKMKKEYIETMLELKIKELNRPKEFWEGEKNILQRKLDLRKLKLDEGDFIEIFSKSKKTFDLSIGIRASKVEPIKKSLFGPKITFDDPIFSFWPYIDSPLSDCPETVWEKDIVNLSEFSTNQFMFFSNKKEKAKKLFSLIKEYPDDFDLFYLSQNDFYSYYRITDNITNEKIDGYIKNFVNLVDKIEETFI
jgi:hypothetical protein